MSTMAKAALIPVCSYHKQTNHKCQEHARPAHLAHNHIMVAGACRVLYLAAYIAPKTPLVSFPATDTRRTDLANCVHESMHAVNSEPKRCLTLHRSHLNVLSPEPEMQVVPSEVTATVYIIPECPVNTCLQSPLAISHTLCSSSRACGAR